MTTCNTCFIKKEEEEFASRGKGKKRHYKCRKCMNAYTKMNYDQNTQYYIDKAMRRKKEIKAWVNEMKNIPCADCGNSFHFSSMDFDHLGDKKFNIATSANKQYPKEKILEEIAKCEVVCSNCHRYRTWKRANNQ